MDKQQKIIGGNLMNTSKFTKIQVISTLISLLPLAVNLITWSSLPEQMQVNVMPNPLFLPRIAAAVIIPIVGTIIHIGITFVIRNRALKENKPSYIWLCFLMPAVGLLAMILGRIIVG